MIGKVISGGSFGGTVGYVMKEQSRVLETRGVEPPGVREMVEDFEDQARLNPRLQQNVGHVSLSFSPEDAPKLTDERMTQIAREYMQKMGITDTQYLLVRHLDQPHPHCQLVYNRVGDHGQTISDRTSSSAMRRCAASRPNVSGCIWLRARRPSGGNGCVSQTGLGTRFTMRSRTACQNAGTGTNWKGD